MNRFQRSANRIVNGNFGSLKKSLVISVKGEWDYDTQSSSEVTINTSALKRSLTKDEQGLQNVQFGDYVLIITDQEDFRVDNMDAVYDGVPIDIIGVIELPADSGFNLICRTK